jgi:ABC-2 type transport system permease protein
VYIPKYIFALSKVMFSFTNMLFSLVAVVIVAIATKLPITPAILLFPLPLIYVFIFSLGIGLLLASYAVFFRDLLHLYGIILLVWTYLTPIFYPITILPENIRKILIYNPMYVYIDNFREIVLYGRVPSIQSNLLCIVYAIIALIIGTLAFKSVKDKFIFYI